MKKTKLLTVDGSEFTVFYLEQEKPLKIVDDAGVDIDTGKYVAGGFMQEDNPFGLDKTFAALPYSNSGPIGAKGDTGWKGEQEAYAGEMILPEDMVRGRLYKVEGVDMVARFMDEYDDFLFQMRHHKVVFYIPMDAKVRKIGKSEIDEYLS